MEARLVYVMGPSGVGKDSLIQGLAERRPDIVIAHRYITRVSGVTENSIQLSQEAFDQRVVKGLFCMHWQAHGHQYGVGTEVCSWLESGQTVVLNGSRRMFECAQRVFEGYLLPVSIVADTEALRERLLARGRESHHEIEKRLQQAALFKQWSDQCRHCIDNSHDLGHGIDRLETLIDTAASE